MCLTIMFYAYTSSSSNSILSNIAREYSAVACRERCAVTMRKLARCKNGAVQMDKIKASWQLDELDAAQMSLEAVWCQLQQVECSQVNSRWEKGLTVGIAVALDLYVPCFESSSAKRNWLEVVSSGNGDKVVTNAIKHYNSALGSSLLDRLPLQFM